MHHPDGDFIYESETRSTEAEVARLPRAVSSTWQRERGVQRRVWRGPRTLCFRGGDCEAAGVRSGFGDSTLSDGVWHCSGATATGPAWRCLLGMESSASLFSLSAWVSVFMATTCVDKWLAAAAWPLSICVVQRGIFNRVDVPIHPVRLSMVVLSVPLL